MENSSLYLTVALLILIILFFIFVKVGRTRVSKRKRNEVFRQLSDIKQNIDLGLGSANRDSIVRLDSLLSSVLRYIKGNKLSCGENLKLINSMIKKDLYNDIWKFHKLRNRVVHENIEVGSGEIKEAYKVYYKLITELL
jgi:hypothetical protein